MSHRSALLALAVILAASGRAQAERAGVMVDAGLPDGANLSLVARASLLRFHAGAGSNAAGPGVRAGLMLAPRWSIAPTLSVEAGRYFAAELAGWQVAYDYASARVGIEIGNRRAAMFLAAGMSWVNGLLVPPAEEGHTVPDGVQLAGVALSARIGIIVHIFH